ncbi:MAG: dTDP-4-dehydrorhamnose reductase [Thainema sp.]
MRIVLTGITGQVGAELNRLLSDDARYQVIGLDRQALDLFQPDKIEDAIAPLQPDLIINPAAYTAVDKAETEADLAHRINAEAPAQLAQAAEDLEIPLIHVSTDYVFNGQQSTPYRETDPTDPLGVYGKTKLLGEQKICDRTQRFIILRTAWVYGTEGGGNFVKTMLRLGAEREELRVVADQIGSPTWAREIASEIAHFIPKLMTNQASDLYGTYHFTNSGIASWYDFAVAIFEEAQELGLPLQVQQVTPITTADYPTPARRPAYSVLHCAKIATVLGTSPPHWRQSLRQMLRDYVQAHESADSLRR